MDKRRKWSIFYAPHRFFGLSITTSPTEKLNDMLKEKIPHETTVQNIIRKSRKLHEEIRHRPILTDRSKLIRVYKDSRLTRVQRNIGSKVFMRFMEYYTKSLELRARPIRRLDDGEPQTYAINLPNGRDSP